MQRLTVSLFVGFMIGAAASPPSSAQEIPAVTVRPLNDHLYLIQCTGGEEFGLPAFATNLVASVGQDGLVLVDAGFASTREALRDTLRRLCPEGRRVVVNTHADGDHAFGNAALKHDALIMAHEDALRQMSGYYYNLPGPPDPNRPDAGFADSLILQFNGEEIRIVHTPRCHSGGDAYVYFVKSGIVAAGDLFFADEIPFVNLAGGGSVAGYLAQIGRFIEDFPAEVVFLPGHGRSYARDDMRAYLEMLERTAGVVRDSVAAGRTCSQIVEADALAEWREWEGSFPTTTLAAWIQTVCYEARGGVDNRPSICEPLTTALASGPAQDAVDLYRRIQATESDAYNFQEPELNMLGYQLMMRGRTADALNIFRLNIEAYPESFNVYDSYAEGLAAAGDTAAAVTNYRKSLELNPQNANAARMLEKLQPAEH